MGLAASQARMLLLTARKNDVESQLMSIANQKLSLSRQSADLSKKYSDALNATKFAWDTSNGTTDLNYDLFMNPSNAINSSGQYLLRNTNTNAVLLSPTTAALLGLNGSGGAGAITSIYSQAEFVAAAMGVTSATAKAQVTSDVADIGSNSTDIAGKIPGSSTSRTINSFSTAYADDFIRAELVSKGYTAKNGINERGGSSAVGYSSNNCPYPVCFYSSYDEDYDFRTDLARAALNTVVSDITTDVSSALTQTLKNNYGDSWSDELQEILKIAMIEAQKDTIKQYGTSFSALKTQVHNGDAKDMVSGTNIIVNATNDEDDYWMDYNQVITTFLNYFDAQCATLNSDDQTANWFKNRNLGTTAIREANGISTDGTCTVDMDETTTVEEVEEDSPSDTLNTNGVSDTYEEKYYMNLYNALKIYGWEVNEGITTEEGLQSQLLYGNVSMLQLTTGGWASLSSSDVSSPLISEYDDDAVDKAAAEYEAAKDQIDYKESNLDIRMNNLDVERSAIETEVESVQKIISKNIEKSFKMFDA